MAWMHPISLGLMLIPVTPKKKACMQDNRLLLHTSKRARATHVYNYNNQLTNHNAKL
jgi:hypothetical protein